MASQYLFENREQRIERMSRDNPGRPIELCTAVVDGIWDKKRELILGKIPERFRDANIEDFGYLTRNVIQSLEKILDNPTKNDKVGLIFCGPPGSGKTHAAYAVIKWLVEKNPEIVAYMASYPQVVQALRTEFLNGSYDELGSVWDKLNNDSRMYDGVILIDDVSSQKQTDFEVDKLMMFLDNRMDNFMPFIITTNVGIKDFKESFGERLASRLLGYCEIIPFDPRDKRLENNNPESHGE